MKGLRDELSRYLPSWLNDAFPDSPSWGFRYLWTCALVVDTAIDVVLRGALARKGILTESALPYVGEARGVVRGRVETVDAYLVRLRGWVARARLRGSQEGLARAVQEYVGPVRVRVVNRHGFWTTINADGTLERYEGVSLNWDSGTNPERAGFLSEEWIIIYSTPYAQTPGTIGDGEVFGDDGFGLGHAVPNGERDVLRTIIADHKAAHSYVRAVIWTSDATLFDPTNPASLPDGHWGQWGQAFGSPTLYALSNRNLTTCRYWEFTNG